MTEVKGEQLIFSEEYNTESNKMEPLQTISFAAVISKGKYRIKVENHDILAGPTLSFRYCVTKCDENGTKKDLKPIIEEFFPRLGSKINIFEISTADVAFVITEQQAPCLLEIYVRNEGSLNRGCKASVYVWSDSNESVLKTTNSKIWKEKEDMDIKIPDSDIPHHFLDPITFDIMKDPVFCDDGHTYDRESIEQWLKEHNSSPLTGLPLKSTKLIPNHNLRSAIHSFIDEYKNKKKDVKKDEHKDVEIE